MSDTQNKISSIVDELNTDLVERNEQVEGAILALVSKQNMLMLGVPGTAKSLLTNMLCERIEGANYFQWLLTKFSTPDELYGPVSLKALENDEYTRITKNKIPEAEIAFLDEIFKANSAILNSLLTLINEKMYHNNGTPHKVPLQSVFGASNELPEGEELNALYDRFALRYMINYISDDSEFIRMLELGEDPAAIPATKTTLTLAELEQAQNEARKVTLSRQILEVIARIRNKLNEEGVLISDRRFKVSLNILKAQAYINGRTAVLEDDLEILKNVLWDRPEEIKTVHKVILSESNPLMELFTELLDQATEVYNDCMARIKEDETTSQTEGIEANGKLKKISEKMVKLYDTEQSHGSDTTRFDTHLKTVKNYNAEILKTCLGLE